MLCLGKHIIILVVGRTLQGLSAAMVWTVGLALMVDTVGRNKIGQAMGYVSISLTLAPPLALVLGGVVYDRAGDQVVYIMAFVVIVFDVVLRFVLIEKKIAAQWREDLEGRSFDEDVLAHQQRLVVIGPAEMVDASEHISSTISPGGDSFPPIGEIEPEITTATSSRGCLPPVLTMLASRRILSALWCSLVQAAILSSLESVRYSYHHHRYHHYIFFSFSADITEFLFYIFF